MKFYDDLKLWLCTIVHCTVVLSVCAMNRPNACASETYTSDIFCTHLFPDIKLHTVQNHMAYIAVLQQPDVKYIKTVSHTVPANLILTRSSGCSASVDTTPPLSPANRFSTFTWLKTCWTCPTTDTAETGLLGSPVSATFTEPSLGAELMLNKCK